MDNLNNFINNPNDETFRAASESVSLLGRSALPTLKKAFKHASDSRVRVKLLKLIGSIEDSSVVPFLKKALEDNFFEVRRTAALSLKILTNEDYHQYIYRSDVGRTLKRNFWCNVDFIDEETLSGINLENKETLKSVALFFKMLQPAWTYSEPTDSKFFSFRRKKHLLMAEDGRTLFKNFNHSLNLMLDSGKKIIFLTDKLVQTLESEFKDKDEMTDILRCLKLSLGTQFKILEEGLCGFLACFHYVRSEFNLALPSHIPQIIPPLTSAINDEDKHLYDILFHGFIDFEELYTSDHLHADKVVRHLIMLRKILIELLEYFKDFIGSCCISPDSYLTFKQIGQAAMFASVHNLNLLSYWAKNE